MRIDLDQPSCPGTQTTKLYITPETDVEAQLLYNLIPDPKTQCVRAIVRRIEGEMQIGCHVCGQGGARACIEIEHTDASLGEGK